MADENFELTQALRRVSSFFEDFSNVQDVLSLPPSVICCLSAVVSFLLDFKLEAVLRNWTQWKPLSEASPSSPMPLSGAATRHLELLRNSSDSSERGSLFWTANFTRTGFGRKLLQDWLTRPLRDVREIEARQDAVMEVAQSDSIIWKNCEKMLTNLPDLQKLLCAAFYHRCTCSEFLTLVKTLAEVKKDLINLSSRIEAEIKDSSLKKMVQETLTLLQDVEMFSQNINETFAREADKTKLFLDTSKYPEVSSCEKEIKAIEERLNELKPEIARTIQLPAFNYTAVNGQKYLIEVKKNKISLVPSNWKTIGSYSTVLISRLTASN